MQVKIVPIGNSRGIRLPKAVLQQCGLVDEAEIDVHPDHLIVRPVRRRRRPRAGWETVIAEEVRRHGAPPVDSSLGLSADEADQQGWTW